jgi:hypothetical protein
MKRKIEARSTRNCLTRSSNSNSSLTKIRELWKVRILKKMKRMLRDRKRRWRNRREKGEKMRGRPKKSKIELPRMRLI